MRVQAVEYKGLLSAPANVYKLVIISVCAGPEIWEWECHGWARVYLQGATPTVTISLGIAGVHLATFTDSAIGASHSWPVTPFIQVPGVLVDPESIRTQMSRGQACG